MAKISDEMLKEFACNNGLQRYNSDVTEMARELLALRAQLAAQEQPLLKCSTHTRAAPPVDLASPVPDLSVLDRLAGAFLQSSLDSNGKAATAYAECAHLLATAVKNIRAGSK